MSVSEFMKFVSDCPTAVQAADAVCRMLDEAGFIRLEQNEPWDVHPAGRYYTVRNHSAVIALRTAACGAAPLRIVASHSDSPTFRLKPLCESNGDPYLRLNTEPYGGGIYSTWFDRPLSIAGRVFVRENGRISERPVCFDRDLVLIPNMPIHFNREVNQGTEFNAQTDLLPILDASEHGTHMNALLAAELGCAPEDIVSSDLYLYNRTPGSVWGASGDFFSCPRIDDLECVWTSLKAFLSEDDNRQTSVFAMLDNEEVGSGTRQGADSDFLRGTLQRAFSAMGADADALLRAAASGFMISADNAHAVHPAHSEKYDAQNRTRMNGGVVIKYNAAQQYMTDGYSDAVFSEICREAGVPVQYFTNRSDIRGGSTLGHIASTQLSVPGVDIGLAQLAMHSSYETAGVRDLDHMIAALRKFYATELIADNNGFSLK